MVARNYFSHNDIVNGESLVKIEPVARDCIDAGESIGFSHDTILNAKTDITGVAVKL